MLILVVILFLLCWGPRLIMEIIIKFDFISSYNHIIYTLRIIFYLLPFIHSCLNPIVYGLMSTKFRRRMILCLQKRCICMKCRRQMSRESGQRLTNGMCTSMSTTFCTRNDISRYKQINNIDYCAIYKRFV